MPKGVGQTNRLKLLRQRQFRNLWAARNTSAIGDRMVPIAQVFAVIKLTGSGADLGVVLAAGMIPNLVFLLIGGVFGDRFRRNRVMLGSDVVRAVSQGVIAVLLLAGHASIVLLVISSAVWGTAAAFFNPASAGLMPLIVEADELQAANALMTLTRNAIGIGAPAVAGLLVAAFGAGTVFAIDSASFVASALFLSRLALETVDRPAKPSLVTQLGEGWAELRSRRWLWATIIGFSLWNAALASFFVLGPLVASRYLGGAGAWGEVMTGTAIGAILGGMLAMRTRPKRPLVALWLLLCVPPIEFALLLPPAPAIAIAAAATVSMTCVMVAATLWTTTLQRQIPKESLSRVSAYDGVGSLVAMPIGYAVAGSLAQWVGLRTTLVSAGLLMLGASLVLLLLPDLWAIRQSQPREEAVTAKAAA